MSKKHIKSRDFLLFSATPRLPQIFSTTFSNSAYQQPITQKFGTCIPRPPNLEYKPQTCNLDVRLRGSTIANKLTMIIVPEHKTEQAVIPSTQKKMCFYEKIKFSCSHVEHLLIQHCHFARNDPGHQCFGAWNVRREWYQREMSCSDCVRQKQYNSATHGGQSAYTVASGR